MITNLKCEYVNEPIGVDNSKPVFSWNIEGVFGQQKDYRIIVKFKNKVYWDSGIVKSSNEIFIKYDGDELRSLKRYYYEVIVNYSDNTQFKKSSFFVTGLMNIHDKNAKWITHPFSHDNPIFYKDISIKGEIKEAFIAISGLGYYEFTINDVKAHSSILVPGWTDYMERDLSNLKYPYSNNTNKRTLYNTYDIKEFFKKGNNLFKVMLGNGWFNQKERNVEGDMTYGDPRLFAKINIEYINGEKQEIITDENFFATEGPYEFNNIYYGEIYNDNIGRDFSYLINAEISNDKIEQMDSQITGYDKISEVLKANKISENIYSINKNISGFVKVKAKATRGAKFTIKFFEKLNDDMTPNYKSCGGHWQIQQDTYIFFDDNEIEYEPKFTWHGFKYFQIEKDKDVNIIDINVLKVHSDIRIKSKVETDNETVNWLYNTYINTQLSNYHGLVPSDCPHRERLGYTGDGHTTIDASMYILDSYYLYMKWNKDIITSKNLETGYIPHTVPFYGGGGGPIWGMAVAIVPYTIYQHTFDKRVLEDSIDAIKGYIEYLKSKSKDMIIEKEEEGSWCLGEWSLPVEGYKVEEVNLKELFEVLDPMFVNTCYFYYVVEITEIICQILGEDSNEYNKLKNEIKDAINDKYLNKNTGRYYKGEYGANIYPLYFDIVNKADKQSVIDSLEMDIIKNDYKMNTGIFSTKMLPKVLLENNKEYLFEKMINNNDYPSFGYMKNNGATTIWETWDNSTSINHPMFGGITSYIFKYIAGIKYINNKNEIVINPNFKIGINKVNIEYESIYGNIIIKWQIKNEKVDIEITIPGNVKVVFINKEEIKVLDKIYNKFIIKRD